MADFIPPSYRDGRILLRAGLVDVGAVYPPCGDRQDRTPWGWRFWGRANTTPEGHALKCLDGDRQNTDPANWVPIPLALRPRLNGKCGRGYDTAPAELKPVILATARLAQAAQDLKKGKRNG